MFRYFAFFLFCAVAVLSQQQTQYQWKNVTYGISYTNTSDFNNEGHYRRCIVVAIGTHGAELNHVQTWLDNLYIKKLRELGFSNLYAVQGPKNPDFDLKEQANEVLIRDLLKVYNANEKPFIVVLAHAEGAYVAHALFERLRLAEYLSVHLYRKIIYFMLDGTAGGYDPELETKLLKTFGVYAFSDASESDNKKYSRYYGSLSAIHYKHPHGSELIAIDGSKSGCETNYCLQNVLINKRPARADSNDIELDYTKFGRDRRVTYDYLEVLDRETL